MVLNISIGYTSFKAGDFCYVSQFAFESVSFERGFGQHHAVAVFADALGLDAQS